MKKLLLSISICLMGLSVQAMRDWRDEPQAAKDYFQKACNVQGCNIISREDIRDAMRLFPDFLTWKFFFGNVEATTAHIVISNQSDPDVLRYFLGFSPDLEVPDSNGLDPRERCESEDLRGVFSRYQWEPWRHPNNVFELSVDHEQYIYDHKKFGGEKDLRPQDDESDDSTEEIFIEGPQGNVGGKKPHAKVFDRKILGGLGAIALLGLFYKYYVNKDTKRSTAS